MALRVLSAGLARIIGIRSIHLSAIDCGRDQRDKRAGHFELSDQVEGESEVHIDQKGSFDLIDENVLNKVINNVKFKDIPIMYLKCTRNNTKISLFHGNGECICVKTCGTEGFKNCRKGTTVAAQAVANRVVTIASDNEVNMARLVFDGLGPGRNAAYKVIELSGLNIVSLSDRTNAVEPWTKRPRKAKRL